MSSSATRRFARRVAGDDGRPFVETLAGAGLLPGIKVDRGTQPLAGAPGERVTEGLDALRERRAESKRLGARFAKWRAVITIGEDGREPEVPHGRQGQIVVDGIPTFGFATAVEVGKDLVRNLMKEAATTELCAWACPRFDGHLG